MSHSGHRSSFRDRISSEFNSALSRAACSTARVWFAFRSAQCSGMDWIFSSHCVKAGSSLSVSEEAWDKE